MILFTIQHKIGEASMSIVVREVNAADFKGLMSLYLFLHDNEGDTDSQKLLSVWEQIISDKNYHILVGETDNRIVSSVSVIIIKNLTRHARPYAVLENVITHPDYRNIGYASKLIQRAVEYAKKAGCYKTFLVTGSKDPNTLKFYQDNGFNQNDKTAFIMWHDIEK